MDLLSIVYRPTIRDERLLFIAPNLTKARVEGRPQDSRSLLTIGDKPMEYRKDKVLDVIIIHIYLMAILFSIATLVAIIWVATKLGKVWSWLTNTAIYATICRMCGFFRNAVRGAANALPGGDKSCR